MAPMLLRLSIAASTSGGTLAKAAWERIATEFLDSIRAAPPVDGVYFCMHGAMASEVELDPEGWLLAETRKILGADIPIVRPDGSAHPLPLLDDVGIGFLDQGAEPAEHLAPPVAQLLDPCIDKFGG